MANDVQFTYRAETAQFDRNLEQSKSIVGDLARDLENLNKQIESGGKIREGSGGWLEFASKVNKEMLSFKTAVDDAEVSMKDFQALRQSYLASGGTPSGFTKDMNEYYQKYNELRTVGSEVRKFFDKNKIDFEDDNKQLISQIDLLKEIANLIQRAKQAGTPALIGKVLEQVGLSKSMLPMLEQGGEGLKKLMDQANTAGAVMEAQDAERAAKIEARWNKIASDQAQFWRGSTNWIVNLVNAFGDMTRIQDIVEGWYKFERAILTFLGNLPGYIGTAFTWIDQLVTNVVRAVIENAINLVAGATAQIRTAFAPVNDLFTWLEGKINACLEAGATLLAKVRELFGMVMTLPPVEAFTDVVRGTMGKALEVTGRPVGDEYTGPGAQFPQKPPVIPEDNKEKIRLAMMAAREQIQAAQMAYEKTAEMADFNAKLFKTTEDQKTTALLAALQKRTSAELVAITKEIATLKELDAADPMIKRLENQKTQVAAKDSLERQKIQHQEIERWEKEWESALGQVQSAWDGQMEKLLSRTETWGQAMKNIVKSLVLDWIKEFEKAALNKLAAQIALSGVGLQGGVGGAAFAGLASLFGGAAKDAALVTNTTALTALTAALTLNTAELQIRNVEGAIPGFAVGAWEIPSTMAGVLHAGEMIVPEGPAEALRSGAGIGGGSVTFSPTINAIDARSVQAFMSDYAPQMAVAVAQHQRKNPGTFG